MLTKIVVAAGDFGNEAVDIVRDLASVDVPKSVMLGNHDAWWAACVQSHVRLASKFQAWAASMSKHKFEKHYNMICPVLSSTVLLCMWEMIDAMQDLILGELRWNFFCRSQAKTTLEEEAHGVEMSLHWCPGATTSVWVIPLSPALLPSTMYCSNFCQWDFGTVDFESYEENPKHLSVYTVKARQDLGLFVESLNSSHELYWYDTSCRGPLHGSSHEEGVSLQLQALGLDFIGYNDNQFLTARGQKFSVVGCRPYSSVGCPTCALSFFMVFHPFSYSKFVD